MTIASVVLLILIVAFWGRAVLSMLRRVIDEGAAADFEAERRRREHENLYPNEPGGAGVSRGWTRPRLRLRRNRVAVSRRDPLVEPSPTLPGIPTGKTFGDFFAEGMVDLRIHLIQQARKRTRGAAEDNVRHLSPRNTASSTGFDVERDAA